VSRTRLWQPHRRYQSSGSTARHAGTAQQGSSRCPRLPDRGRPGWRTWSGQDRRNPPARWRQTRLGGSPLRGGGLSGGRCRNLHHRKTSTHPLRDAAARSPTPPIGMSPLGRFLSAGWGPLVPRVPHLRLIVSGRDERRPAQSRPWSCATRLRSRHTSRSSGATRRGCPGSAVPSRSRRATCSSRWHSAGRGPDGR